MTGWQLIGGDPAPGSPRGVEAAATAFDKVVSHVEKIRDGLRGAGAEHSVASWKGEAAEKFRSQVKTLPRDLGLVALSYRQASAALRVYASALRDAQQTAVRIRESARQAAETAHRAESERNRYEEELRALDARLRSARLRRDETQRRYNEATDPAVRSTLQAELGAARALVSRLESDHRATVAARDRHERARRTALDHLERQRRAATVVRDRMSRAADTAVRKLERAEKEAQLPGWLTRSWEDGALWVRTYGPVFADTFCKGAEWFSIAAKLLPPGAPIFLTFAAVFGGLSVLSHTAVLLASDDGPTAEELWKLGGSALVTVGAVAGIGALVKGAKVGTLAANSAKVAKYAGYAKQGTEVGESYAVDGWAGAQSKVTGIVVGYGVGVVSTHAVKGIVAGLNSNPVTSSVLDAASASLKDAKPQTVDLDRMRFSFLKDLGVEGSATLDGRAMQSILGYGRIPPGGFLPAHEGAEFLASHGLPGEATTEAIKESGAPEAVTWVAEEGATWLADRFGTENTGASIPVTLPIRPTPEDDTE